jgi:pentatricopeptide repeat protein
MQQVCTEFENDNDTDDAATKNSRFEKILTLMQQMQECGHPPKVSVITNNLVDFHLMKNLNLRNWLVKLNCYRIPSVARILLNRWDLVPKIVLLCN